MALVGDAQRPVQLVDLVDDDLRAEAGSLPAPALLRLKRPSMKWLETAFAEDVGGALLAFRAGGMDLFPNMRKIFFGTDVHVINKERFTRPLLDELLVGSPT